MAEDTEAAGGQDKHEQKDVEGPNPSGKREQDVFVQRLRPDPNQSPPRTFELSGLQGNSDRPGYRRLYFNRSLDYYAEFRAEDVLHVETVPPDQPPLVGLEATQVTLPRDASVDYTRSRQGPMVDEFDLDIQLQRGPGVDIQEMYRTSPRICRTINVCEITDITCNCQTQGCTAWTCWTCGHTCRCQPF